MLHSLDVRIKATENRGSGSGVLELQEICRTVNTWGLEVELKNTIEIQGFQGKAGVRLLGKLRHLKAPMYTGSLNKSIHRDPGKMHSQNKFERTQSLYMLN